MMYEVWQKVFNLYFLDSLPSTSKSLGGEKEWAKLEAGANLGST